LTKTAAQVASSCSKGQNTGARQEMIERFFLDGINAKACALAISRENHLSIEVLTNETEAAIALFQNASTRTKIAMDALAILNSMPPTSRIADSAMRQAVLVPSSGCFDIFLTGHCSPIGRACSIKPLMIFPHLVDQMLAL
jgi:hypothetical protein